MTQDSAACGFAVIRGGVGPWQAAAFRSACCPKPPAPMLLQSAYRITAGDYRAAVRQLSCLTEVGLREVGGGDQIQ